MCICLKRDQLKVFPDRGNFLSCWFHRKKEVRAIGSKQMRNKDSKSTKCEWRSIAFRCPLYFKSHAKAADHVLNQSRGTAGSRGYECHHIRHQHTPWYTLHKNLPGLPEACIEASTRKATPLVMGEWSLVRHWGFFFFLYRKWFEVSGFTVRRNSDIWWQNGITAAVS